jgi:hypothetical protein
VPADRWWHPLASMLLQSTSLTKYSARGFELLPLALLRWPMPCPPIWLPPALFYSLSMVRRTGWGHLHAGDVPAALVAYAVLVWLWQGYSGTTTVSWPTAPALGGSTLPVRCCCSLFHQLAGSAAGDGASQHQRWLALLILNLAAVC